MCDCFVTSTPAQKKHQQDCLGLHFCYMMWWWRRISEDYDDMFEWIETAQKCSCHGVPCIAQGSTEFGFWESRKQSKNGLWCSTKNHPYGFSTTFLQSLIVVLHDMSLDVPWYQSRVSLISFWPWGLRPFWRMRRSSGCQRSSASAADFMKFHHNLKYGSCIESAIDRWSVGSSDFSHADFNIF